MKKTSLSDEPFKKFEFLEGATADVLFKAYGRDLDEAFGNAGLAMFEVMVDTKQIEPLITKRFTKQSEDLKSLLYDFLEELLYLHESEGLVFNEFLIKINPKIFTLTAIVKGDNLKEGFEVRSVVKAVTYHEMEVKKTDKGFSLKVLLDI